MHLLVKYSVLCSHFNIILITPIHPALRSVQLKALKGHFAFTAYHLLSYPIAWVFPKHPESRYVAFNCNLAIELSMFFYGFRLSTAHGGDPVLRKGLWVTLASGKPVWVLIHPYPTATQNTESAWRLLVANATGQQTRNIESAWRIDDESGKRNWETNLEWKNASPVLYCSDNTATAHCITFRNSWIKFREMSEETYVVCKYLGVLMLCSCVWSEIDTPALEIWSWSVQFCS